MNVPTEKTKQVAIIEAIQDPVTFAYSLGLSPYEWQCHVMWKLQKQGSKVVLRAANSSGKTFMAAIFVLWHALRFPGSKCVLTAGAFRQVQIIFGEMRKFSKFFPKGEFLDVKITLDNGSIILGFATNDPGLFEGHHNSELLIVIDEGKTVLDPIYEAATRCVPTRYLIMSSPGLPFGYFYECFNGLRAKLFTPFHVRASDCPHITKETIDQVALEHGKDSRFYRSMIEGEFTADGNSRVIIKADHLERCLLTPPPFRDNGEIRAFCDLAFSATGDENVLALRKGNRITLEDTWIGDGNTINTAHRFIKNFERLKLKPEEIFADNGGAGHAIIDQMASMGWKINRVNNGATSSYPDKYCNRHVQWWFNFSRMIEENQLILPDDPILKSQLISRCYEPDLKNRLKLESKSLISGSPDRGDAVIAAAQASPFNYGAFSKSKKWYDDSHAIDLRRHRITGEGMVGNRYLGRG